MKTRMNRATLAWLALSCALLAGCGGPNDSHGGPVVCNSAMPVAGAASIRNPLYPLPPGYVSVQDAPAASFPLPAGDPGAAPGTGTSPSIRVTVSLGAPGWYYRRVSVELEQPDALQPGSGLIIAWNSRVTQAYQVASYEEDLAPGRSRVIRLEMDVFRVPMAPATDDASRVLGSVTLESGDSRQGQQQGPAIEVYDDQNDPTYYGENIDSLCG